MQDPYGYILCHGWGSGPDFWNPLLPFLQPHPYVLWDLGYGGHPYQEIPEKKGHTWIGVGHSLGFIKLLQSGYGFQKLIGVNAFLCFLGHDPSLKRRRSQELSHLTAHFQKDPLHTLRRFKKRSSTTQTDSPSLSSLQLERLHDDLVLLQKTFSPHPNIPTLFLNAQDDPVVPPQVVEDNLGLHLDAHSIFWQHGGHNLVEYHPSRLYDTLQWFHEEYYTPSI